MLRKPCGFEPAFQADSVKRRGGWECGECGGWWPSAVPTCIDCLIRDRDGAVNALAQMCRERDQARREIAELKKRLGYPGFAR